MNKIAEKAIGSASDSVRKLNPDVFQTAESYNAPKLGRSQLAPGSNPLVECAKPKGKTLVPVFAAEGKRIKQGEKKPGRWEAEWQAKVEASNDFKHVKAQSVRVRLANGAWYKPDVTAVTKTTPASVLHCWEVKGGKGMKGVAKGTLALKVAAATYPEMRWFMVWKENGAWKQQEVLS